MKINFINTSFDFGKIIDLPSGKYNDVIEYSILYKNITTRKTRSIIIEDIIVKIIE